MSWDNLYCSKDIRNSFLMQRGRLRIDPEQVLALVAVFINRNINVHFCEISLKLPEMAVVQMFKYFDSIRSCLIQNSIVYRLQL